MYLYHTHTQFWRSLVILQFGSSVDVGCVFVCVWPPGLFQDYFFTEIKYHTLIKAYKIKHLFEDKNTWIWVTIPHSNMDFMEFLPVKMQFFLITIAKCSLIEGCLIVGVFFTTTTIKNQNMNSVQLNSKHLKSQQQSPQGALCWR